MKQKQSLAEVDALLAAGGLRHGTRRTRQYAAPVASASPKQIARAARPRVLQVPGWEEYRWLRHGFSTRAGGYSTAYSADRKTGELNLGLTASDDAENVQRNRELLLNAAGAKGAELRTLRQIHSGHIVHEARAGVPKGDGQLSDMPGHVLAIQTADCVPVLLVDPEHRAVAAFHAGWRGTVKRMVERGVGDMRRVFGSRPEKLKAAIGPSIGPCCYAVGEEVIAEFTSQFAYTPELLTEVSDSDPIRMKYPMLFLTARAPGHSDLGPQIHLDLWEANRRQLLDAGLRSENIWVARECTACHTEKYFSHRAEHGFTGRMMAVIGVQ